MTELFTGVWKQVGSGVDLGDDIGEVLCGCLHGDIDEAGHCAWLHATRVYLEINVGKDNLSRTSLDEARKWIEKSVEYEAIGLMMTTSAERRLNEEVE